MNIGKLYKNKKYFWFLYPSKEIASAAAAAAMTVVAFTPTAVWADDVAAYWGKQFSCNVSYISPSNIFMLLEQDRKLCKVLSTNGELGWISYLEDVVWYNDIEEVNQ